MSIFLSLTQDQTQAVLRSFLLGILPIGTEVFVGQDNRVPEPTAADFVVFTPIRRERIATNSDTFTDCLFTSSIAGGNLSVTNVAFGTIVVGRTLFGADVLDDTSISGFVSGTPGGIGVYTVSQNQTIVSELMAAGAEDLLQPTKVTFQCDVHGPSSADNAQIISTLFRDEYATSRFALLSARVSPLYADDPRQLPFWNAESQTENRWVVEAVVQADQSVVVPQQFASAVHVGLINVEATYPVV